MDALYKECTVPMKDMTNIEFSTSPNWLTEKYFGTKRYERDNTVWSPRGINSTC